MIGSIAHPLFFSDVNSVLKLRMHRLLMSVCPGDAFQGDNQGPHRDGAIGDIKHWPDLKVNKVDDIPITNTVNQVPDRPGQDHGKSHNIKAAQLFIIGFIIINIIHQQNDRDHRDNNKHNPVVLKQSERDPRVMNKRHVQDMTDHWQRLPFCQDIGEKNFSNAVQKNDKRNSEQGKENI